MALGKGRDYSGLIVGDWFWLQGPMLDSRGPKVMAPVIKALSDYHDLKLTPDESTYRDHGPIPYRHHSGEIQAGPRGSLVRVLAGSGSLRVAGMEPVSVDYGYWVFVPAGVVFCLTGMVISGMSLQFATMNVS